MALALLAVTCATTSSRTSAAEPEGSAAVDSACPWGRLSDGRGRLVRCLSREEAERLRAPNSSSVQPQCAPPAGAAESATPVHGASALHPAGSAAAPAAVPPAAGTPSTAVAPESSPPPALDVEIGSVTADVGALPDAVKSLKKAREKFVECASKSGAMTADQAEVEVRFLVQARGRAEGVSVKKSRGMAEAAAKCIADVVDRRYVGYPEAPVVGASITVSIKKKK